MFCRLHIKIDTVAWNCIFIYCLSILNNCNPILYSIFYKNVKMESCIKNCVFCVPHTCIVKSPVPVVDWPKQCKASLVSCMYPGIRHTHTCGK